MDDVFAVIAEETRRDILDSLRAGDKAVGQLVEELGASQPTISKHLRVLREASLVSMRAEGQKRFYSLNTVPLQRISGWINAFDGGPAGIGGSPEAEAGNSAEGSAAESPVAGAAATDIPQAPMVGAAVPVLTEVAPDGRRPAAKQPAAAIVQPTSAATHGAETGSRAETGSPAGTESPAGTRAPAQGASPAQAGRAAQAGAAVVVPPATDSEAAPDGTRQLGRSVGRAANKAADLLANLPKFGRRKD